MPAYHSAISIQGVRRIGNVAILPIKCSVRGPGTCLPKDSPQADVIDEALAYFKANVFFRTYEIKSDADRVLIYLTLYIQDCLKKLQRCSSKTQGNSLINWQLTSLQAVNNDFCRLLKVSKKCIHWLSPDLTSLEKRDSRLMESTPVPVRPRRPIFYVSISCNWDTKRAQGCATESLILVPMVVHPNGGLVLLKDDSWTSPWQAPVTCNLKFEAKIAIKTISIFSPSLKQNT